MRRGFAHSGGVYADTRCDIGANGRVQAEDVIGALDALLKRPDVDKDRILLAGQSQGGLAALAVGAAGYPGVRGVLNFAGGFK